MKNNPTPNNRAFIPATHDKTNIRPQIIGSNPSFLKSHISLRETDVTNSQKDYHPKQHLSIDDFRVIGSLGQGKYGVVHLVMHQITGFVGALKTIKKSAVKDEKTARQLMLEIKLQTYMSHMNIIELYSFFTDEDNIYLLMELGCDGQLYGLMEKKDTQCYLQEQTISFLIRELLEGLIYMHREGIIHRDIKPQNIVLIHGIPKICDFGCSVYCPEAFRSTICGTPLYLSPQILSGERYNQKIDTWAIGALTYELYTGSNPFKITMKEHLTRIITDNFEMNIGSKHIRSFVSHCLRKDPQSRPDALKLRHSMFIHKYEMLETSQQLCQ